MTKHVPELPASAIPPECTGCPMIDFAGESFEENYADIEDYTRDRIKAREAEDSANLARVFEDIATKSEKVVATMSATVLADVDAVNKVIEDKPAAATMPVLDFVRHYRTEENRLGDHCLMLALEVIPEKDMEYDEAVKALTVKDALAVQLKALAALIEKAEGKIFLSEETIEKISNVYDTEKLYRDGMEGMAAAIYEASVVDLITHCASGIEEKAGGFRKKKA